MKTLTQQTTKPMFQCGPVSPVRLYSFGNDTLHYLIMVVGVLKFPDFKLFMHAM